MLFDGAIAAINIAKFEMEAGDIPKWGIDFEGHRHRQQWLAGQPGYSEPVENWAVLAASYDHGSALAVRQPA